MMDPGEKGKAFEDIVGLVLDELKKRHLGRVEISKHLRLTLYDGRVVIPDFDFRYRLHHAEERFLIECQDRNRSKADIADKIRTAKTLSRRNKFIFIYFDSIPEATFMALESDGVIVLKFNEFVDFIAKIDMNLTAVEAQGPEQAKEARDAYSRWSSESKDGPPHHHWDGVSEAPPPDWNTTEVPPPGRHTRKVED